VHHDVKPANILLNDYGAAVLTDFGIAVGDEADGETTVMRASRASVESQTSAAGSHGVSVPWAPPEALADNPTSDARSDIYSLGATLYTLLEGRTPFEVDGASNGALQLSRRIEGGELGTFAREAPDDLRALLRSMMSTDPQARPASGQQVAEMIQSIQREQGQAITPIELGTSAEELEAIPPSEVAEATVRRSELDEADIDTRTRPPMRRGVEGGVRGILGWARTHTRIVILTIVVMLGAGTVLAVNAIDTHVPTLCPAGLSSTRYQTVTSIEPGGTTDDIAELNEDYVRCAGLLQAKTSSS
jgi:serine/threonine protein kinase